MFYLFKERGLISKVKDDSLGAFRRYVIETFPLWSHVNNFVGVSRNLKLINDSVCPINILFLFVIMTQRKYYIVARVLLIQTLFQKIHI